MKQFSLFDFETNVENDLKSIFETINNGGANWLLDLILMENKNEKW